MLHDADAIRRSAPGASKRRSDSCLKANVVVLALADRRSVALQLVHRL